MEFYLQDEYRIMQEYALTLSGQKGGGGRSV